MHVLANLLNAKTIRLANGSEGFSLNQSSPQFQLVSRSIMIVRDLSIGGLSVCPSVRLSHAGIDSKPMAVGSYGFRHLVAHYIITIV